MNNGYYHYFTKLFPRHLEFEMGWLSKRAISALNRAEIDTLAKLGDITPPTLLDLDGIGYATVNEIDDYFRLYMKRAVIHGDREYKSMTKQTEPPTKEKAMTLQEIHEAVMTMIPEARVVKVQHSYVNNNCGEQWDCHVYGDGEISMVLFMVFGAKDPAELFDMIEEEYKRLDIHKKNKEQIAKLKAQLALLEMAQ